MAHWLLKTEPNSYSWDDLVRDKKATWDGVKNAAAVKNISAMKKGDTVLIYHTGGERAAIGIAEVVSGPYSPPTAEEENRVVVDLKPRKKLGRAVSLDEFKRDPVFADWLLLRIGRLSVVPVPSPMWKRIEQLAAEK